jgi:hypothetical protein
VSNLPFCSPSIPFFEAYTGDAGQYNPQVLLEVSLLDAHLAVPRKHVQEASSSAPARRSVLQSTAECLVRVLVSRAMNLPKVPVVGEDKRSELQLPSPFVVLKSARDATHGGAVQGATQPVIGSCDPVWYVAANALRALQCVMVSVCYADLFQ